MSNAQPYEKLGERLKSIRQTKHESVSEVSGAVEIDDQELQLIEQGSTRPSEDILLLLINHFNVHDDDANTLWRLAGYEPPRDQDDAAPNDHQNNRTMVMIMAVDPRIIYSDGVHITANKSGVVLNFAQGIGTPQVLTTARIGMSRDQAVGLIETMQKALEQSTPRQLPAGKQTKQEPSKRQKKSDDTAN
ncbi:MAG TPA: helix-turn-helix transcriptional regulator [Patescibacteria group bacterium]|nr:helix-turn-helix transcriptional regulator [Patescibacteria group bacterium]